MSEEVAKEGSISLMEWDGSTGDIESTMYLAIDSLDGVKGGFRVCKLRFDVAQNVRSFYVGHASRENFEPRDLWSSLIKFKLM